MRVQTQKWLTRTICDSPCDGFDGAAGAAAVAAEVAGPRCCGVRESERAAAGAGGRLTADFGAVAADAAARA